MGKEREKNGATKGTTMGQQWGKNGKRMVQQNGQQWGNIGFVRGDKSLAKRVKYIHTYIHTYILLIYSTKCKQ